MALSVMVGSGEGDAIGEIVGVGAMVYVGVGEDNGGCSGDGGGVGVGDDVIFGVGVRIGVAVFAGVGENEGVGVFSIMSNVVCLVSWRIIFPKLFQYSSMRRNSDLAGAADVYLKLNVLTFEKYLKTYAFCLAISVS